MLRFALALAILLAHLASIGETRGLVGEVGNIILRLMGSGPPLVEHVPAMIDQASATMGGHAPAIPNMGGHEGGLSRPIVMSHVPMFFALSGFLVSGSALRTRKVFSFLSLRFFRIFPALCVEVVLSALVIGTVFTSLNLEGYFSAPLFWSYFGNIFGIVQMELPGVVFSNSGERVAVNANLWTLPGEFYCYLAMSFLMATGMFFRRHIFTAAFIFFTIALLVANIGFGFNNQAGLTTSNNVYYFFVGMMFYLWREYIPYSRLAAITSSVFCYILITKPFGVYIIPLFLTYITVFVGLTKIPRNRFLQSGDYSYGIYLYGFPISQALAQSFPSLHGNFFGLMITAVLCTMLFSYFSWHMIEKRFLRLKKRFSNESARISAAIHPSLERADRASTDPGMNNV